jgi:hypothetical protein
LRNLTNIDMLIIPKTAGEEKREFLGTGKDEDAVAWEAVLEGEQEFHAVDVVDGALQLVLRSGVVDADKEGALVAVNYRVSCPREPPRSCR